MMMNMFQNMKGIFQRFQNQAKEVIAMPRCIDIKQHANAQIRCPAPPKPQPFPVTVQQPN